MFMSMRRSLILLFCCVAFTLPCTAAVYNSATGELDIKMLINGDRALSPARIRLNPDGTYQVLAGNESDLPFVCPDLTENTPDLIESAQNPGEVSELLKCRPVSGFMSTDFTSADNIDPEISGAFRWFDRQCSLITANFINGKIADISVELKRSEGIGCVNGFYDLNSRKNLRINLTVVDDSTLFSNVVLKLSPLGTFQLVSIQALGNENRAEVCAEFDEEKFTAISNTMGVAEIDQLLGCNWSGSSFKVEGNNLVTPELKNFVWIDSFCQEITATVDVNSGNVAKKSLTLKSAGCTLGF